MHLWQIDTGEHPYLPHLQATLWPLSLSKYRSTIALCQWNICNKTVGLCFTMLYSSVKTSSPLKTENSSGLPGTMCEPLHCHSAGHYNLYLQCHENLPPKVLQSVYADSIHFMHSSSYWASWLSNNSSDMLSGGACCESQVGQYLCCCEWVVVFFSPSRQIQK
jgi:hypothetical protein